MTIKHVILGLLSESPATGYDLKKTFSDSELFHWSGNNNQIYRALSELHQEAQVTIETVYQDSRPPRKIYSLTEAGRTALREWVVSMPDLPQFRNDLLVRLQWADQAEPQALSDLLARCEEELEAYVALLREKMRRQQPNPTARGTATLRERAAAHGLAHYQLDLDWIRTLRQELESVERQ